MVIEKRLKMAWLLLSLAVPSSSMSLPALEAGSSLYSNRFAVGLKDFFLSPNFNPFSPVQEPNSVPTKEPTFSPTPAQSYTMFVSQSLSGISSSEFEADYSPNSNAFTASVSESMPGIFSSDISITSVTDASVHRLRHLVSGSASVNINYSVSYNIAVLGYADDPEGCYNHLFTELTTAVTDAEFNVYLLLNSITFNAVHMTNTTSNSVSSSGYAIISDASTVVYDDPLHSVSEKDRIIIGVAASVGGLLLLSLAICCWCYGSNKQPQSPSMKKREKVNTFEPMEFKSQA